jgi:hypothetical protein
MAFALDIHERPNTVRRRLGSDASHLRAIEGGWSPKSVLVGRWTVGDDGRLIWRWRVARLESGRHQTDGAAP